MSSVALAVRSSDFGALVRQRAWDWLSALQRRLGVDRLQLVDESGFALLPEAGAEWPETGTLFAQALHSRAPESARLDDLQVTCVGLVAGDRRRGALLLARQVTDATAAEVRAELEVIGSWLRPAIEAHLGSSAAEAAEQAPRVSALFRVLSGAATAGSEAALLRLYANALAIWHDVELRAYLEDVDGNLRLAITLPGAVAGELPARLDGNQVSIGAELTRVSGHDLEVLGFQASDEAVAARVGDLKQGTVWLLVLSGAIDASTEMRLTLYTDVLRQVLQNVAAASLLDVERTIWQTLVSGEDAQVAAERSLQEVTRAMSVSASALSVTAADDGPGLRAGVPGLLADQTTARSDRLIATTGAEGYPTIVLAVQGPTDHVFSSREREVLNRLARLFASWAGGIWPRSLDAPDRRSIARSFEDVLEESASQAAARGTGSSVVVIRVAEATTRQMQAMAADLRAHVRAGESVGVLGAGEIGLLLYDNTPDVALSVVNRLRHAMTGAEAVELLARAAVGMAHVSPGAAVAPGLVSRARERAPGPSRPSKRRANS